MSSLLQRHGRLLFTLIIFALLIAAADRSALRWDLSADQRFTISEPLMRLLRAQTDAVAIVGLWSSDDDGEYAHIREAVQHMVATNEHLSWRFIDPVLHKPQLAAFSARFHEADAPALYLTRGERAFKISLPNPMHSRFRARLQQEIGGGLAALADPSPPVVVVAQGHGELRPGGGNDDGVDQLIRAWQLAGLRVDVRDLSRDRVRATDVLALLGPTAAIGTADIATIVHHLDDGGALLLLADDLAPADLITLFRQRGVLIGGTNRSFIEQLQTDSLAALRSATVESLSIIASRRRFSVGQDSAHPEPNLVCDSDLLDDSVSLSAAVSASGRAVLSPWSTPVQVMDLSTIANHALAQQLATTFTTLGTPPFTAQMLMRTAAQDAWLKKRADPLTIPADLSHAPPLPLAWAITYQAAAMSAQAGRGARVLVWSSRQAASDGVLGQERWANAQLLIRGVDWLAQRSTATDIPEATTAVFRIDCSDNVLHWLAAALVAIVPCLCIGAAMLTWWDSRR